MIFDNHPNFKWMHVMFMILGTSYKEKLPVDAFSDNFVKVHQSQNWSCKLELGAGVPNCNIDRSPQSSAETSQKCGQPLELILDERKNDNGWIMFELKGDGFYKRCFKLQTAPPTLHSSSFLGRVWRWHHHTLVSRVTCWCHARVTCRFVCRMSVLRENGLLWPKQVIRSEWPGVINCKFVTKTHVG